MVRPAIALAVQRRFWEGVDSGLSVVAAASYAGVSRASGQRLFARCGGVKPFSTSRLARSGSASVSYRRLSLIERHELAALSRAGHGIRAIAAQLGRSPSTISRELARHRDHRGGYAPAAAQVRADRVVQDRGRAASPAKLATRLGLRAEVQRRLRKNHSPEQIARRLREDYPDDPEMWVSHETIYQAIYIQARGGLKRELVKHLRTGRSLRQPRRQAQARRTSGPIRDMVMISQRPAEVADRAVPGHWEGDLIMGSQESNSAIGTLVERTTGFVILVHLPAGHTAQAMQHALVPALTELPDLMRRSLTWDQGREMAAHLQITAATGMQVYFCDPHSPWQRPSNENTNGLLRQYFPKGTDLSFWGPGVLTTVAAELNERPRKRLDWATPAEAYAKLIQDNNPPGVALTP
jgi:transposase, IS30 family